MSAKATKELVDAALKENRKLIMSVPPEDRPLLKAKLIANLFFQLDQSNPSSWKTAGFLMMEIETHINRELLERADVRATKPVKVPKAKEPTKSQVFRESLGLDIKNQPTELGPLSEAIRSVRKKPEPAEKVVEVLELSPLAAKLYNTTDPYLDGITRRNRNRNK